MYPLESDLGQQLIKRSGISFPDTTVVLYYGDGGGRIAGYESWVVRGVELTNVLFKILPLSEWTEIPTKGVLKTMSVRTALAAECTPVRAFMGEWQNGQTEFTGKVLICRTNTYLELVCVPLKH